MKKFFKVLFIILYYILILPCLSFLTFSVTWYCLSASQTTELGILINSVLDNNLIFILTIVCASLSTVLIIAKLCLRVRINSKVSNFYTHVVSWLLMLLVMVQVSYVFMASSTLSDASFYLTDLRKIGIGAIVLLGFAYGIVNPKIKAIINRKIQAYDTVREMNGKARSSVVFIQLLKVIDILFPEILLLAVLCFAFNVEISTYFIYFLSSFALPMIGNIICDLRIKREFVMHEKDKQQQLVDAISEKIQEKE